MSILPGKALAGGGTSSTTILQTEFQQVNRSLPGTRSMLRMMLCVPFLIGLPPAL